MNKALIVLVTLLLVSYAFQSHASWGQPQSGNEFRAAVHSGKGKMKTHVTNHSFKRVISFFARKAKTCLNVKVVSTLVERYGVHKSTTIYTPKMKRTGPKTADFTLQYRTIPKGIGPKMPKDGYYAMVVDFTAQPGNRTKINIYGPRFGYKKLFKAFKTWSEIKNQSCPKLR